MSTAAAAAASTDPCVHCGFCLPTCASYRVLGTEMDSPRGRIHALKAIEAGELLGVCRSGGSALQCFKLKTTHKSGLEPCGLACKTSAQALKAANGTQADLDISIHAP